MASIVATSLGGTESLTAFTVTFPPTVPAFPSSWLETSPGYPGSLSLARNTTGPCRLNIAPTAGGGGVEAGPHLTTDAEARLSMQITHTGSGDSVTIVGVGNDDDEPYAWIPSNAAEVATFANARSNGQALVITFNFSPSNLYVGSERIEQLYVGSTEVQAVYVGTTQVFG